MCSACHGTLVIVKGDMKRKKRLLGPNAAIHDDFPAGGFESRDADDYVSLAAQNSVPESSRMYPRCLGTF